MKSKSPYSSRCVAKHFLIVWLIGRLISRTDGQASLHTYLANVLMQLRKIANHTMLVRSHYSDSQVEELARAMHSTMTNSTQPLHELVEDYRWMSDWQLHTIAKTNNLTGHLLSQGPITLPTSNSQCANVVSLTEQIVNGSGKFIALQALLPKLKVSGKRVLLFSQMTKFVSPPPLPRHYHSAL